MDREAWIVRWSAGVAVVRQYSHRRAIPSLTPRGLNENVGLARTLNDSILRVEAPNCNRSRTRGQSDLIPPSVARYVRRARKKAGPTPRPERHREVPRRVTAAALPRFCAVLKVILAETRAVGRGLERTPPLDARPAKGGVRGIDRRSLAK
jgi:hypothetical protein